MTDAIGVPIADERVRHQVIAASGQTWIEKSTAIEQVSSRGPSVAGMSMTVPAEAFATWRGRMRGAEARCDRSLSEEFLMPSRKLNDRVEQLHNRRSIEDTNRLVDP